MKIKRKQTNKPRQNKTAAQTPQITRGASHLFVYNNKKRRKY